MNTEAVTRAMLLYMNALYASGLKASAKINVVTRENNWQHLLRPWDGSGRTALASAEKARANIIDPVTFARQMPGFIPDEKQELVLRGGRRGIVNCTRQWGKSSVMAAKAVHRAYTVAGSLILVLSPCLRQSGEFVRKAE